MADEIVPAETDTRPKEGQTPETEFELATLWKRAWAWLKWAGTALITIGFILVIGQGYLYYRLFSDINPLLGLAFVLLLTLVLVVLVGRPLWSFFRTPVAALPPQIKFDPKAPTQEAINARLAYDLKFLKSLRKHPELKADATGISDSLNVGKALLDEVKASKQPSARMAQKVLDFETRHIEARLKPLDKRADDLIHSESVAIGMATALSMNGTVDAFIVLWRSSNLVAKLSRIYFGRPNLRGSLLVMRDVAMIVVLSRALENVTDVTGDLIGKLVGRMGGLVAGPVMDGAINAMMALKIGYLTKRRCRAFRGWSQDESQNISAEALNRVQAEAGSVVTEILKACGGLTSTAANAAEQVMRGSQNAWGAIRSWFGVKAEDDKPGAGRAGMTG